MKFHEYYQLNETTDSILESINSIITENDGEIYVVGGPIRDSILGHEPKDIDFLVRKLTLQQLQEILSKLGKTKEVGAHFGIVKAVIAGEEYDFAIPRTKEEKTGDSHTSFSVTTDPFAEVEADLNRRDFSWNSMALPLQKFIESRKLSGKERVEFIKNNIIDPNDGFSDLMNKKLRAVGDPQARFFEDPLRMIRAIQFSTRMGFDISDDTLAAMRKLKNELKKVSGERIFEEFKKAWTKGKADISIMIKLLNDTEIGKLLFGNDFDPIDINFKTATNEEKIFLYFVTFFINGGSFNILKADSKYIKFLEYAKKLKEKRENIYDISSNIEDSDIKLLKEIFSKMDSKIFETLKKMETLPYKVKQLEITGEELKEILRIEKASDMKKIGMVQKAMLKNIWDGKLSNTNAELRNFAIGIDL